MRATFEATYRHMKNGLAQVVLVIGTLVVAVTVEENQTLSLWV